MSTTRPTPKPGAAERERSTYLGLRVKVLQAELKALRDEKRQITETLRAMADKATPEAKTLKGRRVYVNVRPVEAKTELDKIVAERKALVAARTAGT